MSAPATPGPAPVGKPVQPLDRWDLLAIVGVLLLFALAARAPVAASRFGDLDFDIEARQVAAAVSGTGPWSAVDILRAPGPVLYYALPYLLVNGASDQAHWIAACVWNAGWCALALLLIRRAAGSLGGPTAGGLALIAAFALPLWAYYGCGVNGEILAFTGVAALCYGWTQALAGDGRRFRRCALPGMAGLCALLLSKPAALLLVPIGIVAALRLWRSADAARRRAARLSMCLLAAAVMVFLLSSAVLKTLSPRRAGTAQEQYFYWTAFFGSFQFREEPWDWRFWSRNTRQGSADYAAYSREHDRLVERAAATGIPLPQLQKQWVLADLRRNFGLRLRASAVRTLSMNLPLANSVRPSRFRAGPLRGVWGYAVVHAILWSISALLVAMAFLFLAGSDAGIFWLWCLWGPWFALLLFHSATYGEPRYLFPGQPGVIVMAAAAPPSRRAAQRIIAIWREKK